MREDMEKLAEYFDKTDLSAEIEQAEHDDQVDQDPMITTSLRLPKSTLDRVRAVAAETGVRPTQLMRQWIEQRTQDAVQDRERELLGQIMRIFEEKSRVDIVWVREAIHAELEPIRELLERQLAG